MPFSADDSHWSNLTRRQGVNESGRSVENNFPGHRARGDRIGLGANGE